MRVSAKYAKSLRARARAREVGHAVPAGIEDWIRRDDEMEVSDG